LPSVRKTRLALVGAKAEACRQGLLAAGVELSDEPGAAALVDLSLPDEEVAAARGRFSPLLGLATDAAAPEEPAPPATGGARRRAAPIDGRVDAMVRSPADVPQLLALLDSAAEGRRNDQDLEALVDVTAALARGGDPEILLTHVVQRIAGRLTVERCSMVLISADGTGSVVVASDDASARGKAIDLALYPEIREVLLTAAPVVIDDAHNHPLLDPVREHLSGKNITAIAVVPMICEGETVGVLFIRSRTRGGFEPREIAFLSAVGSAAAVALRNAGRIQTERSQRVAAERELHQLRRYEELFAHVNDGMAILDEHGRVLSLNPAGCAILGVGPEAARGLPLQEVVAPESEMEAGLLRRELLRGGRVISADVRVISRDGRRMTLSVSAGPIRSVGRAVLTFRDVSESRELELELRKTKEFLERLIDATEGGIVATDLRGVILLFNKGAEKITGFAAAEVVGKVRVTELYPPGQAQEIMRRLRQGISTTRCEVVAKSGEVIPMDLSAALVAEGGEETAVVGVFRDLRQELRAAHELQETRERLAVAEKAALVSELAGAAAHELNQPLTSVLGFSELLFRRTGEQEKGREELRAILREAERMAGIVKKIGKITRYETTPYVGRTRIVDLDRSSDPPPPQIVIRDKP
jgi:PAS domain S-box-containing protein